MEKHVKSEKGIAAVKPVVKWAGGKRQILPKMLINLPEQWNRYFEPFAGGAAMFLALRNTNLMKSAIIGDSNSELVNLYLEIRDNPEGLNSTIGSIKYTNERQSYTSARAKFNTIKGSEDSKTERAALFLYLNRHCFNGLWRVNSNGNFNVPFGKYRNPSIPNPEEIMKFSGSLQDVEIRCGDFQSTVAGIQPGDFVYFDPPYEPVSRTSSFTSYTKAGFPFSEQKRLSDLCRRLDGMGSYFMVSNSYSTDIMELYSEFKIKEIEAKRVINSDSHGRTGITELMITNY